MGIPNEWPVFDDPVDYEKAQAKLVTAGLSDGLPLVPPTAQRLQAMLAGVTDPDQSLGHMPPLFGKITPAAVAYNCALAGCQPGALALVITTALASIDDSFNLLGIATTTGSPTIATVVHGPICEQLGINAGSNCLGPGTIANATIGRAIALVLRNVAGMRSGAGDMATMGQPGKYGFCFGESNASPFPAMHQLKGLAPSDNAITALGVSGTIEVLPSQDDGNWDTPEAILDPVAQVMHSTWLAGGGFRKPDRGDQVLLLPPELADLIAARSWSLDQVQSYIFERAEALGNGPIAGSRDNILIIVTGGPGTKMTVLPLWGGGTRAITRKVEPL